ncbi:MAG: M1 family metallopeptidase [Steroidobacteraceae bacterium]
MLFWIFLAGAPLTLLAAEPAVRDSVPPVGRLEKTVVPTHYRIELAIDPSKESFSGVVDIDVMLNEPQDAIWLHGKNLAVTEVFLTDKDSARIDASYEERLDSGVALISLSRAAPGGPARLHFAYTAPFNDSDNALYRIERGENHYAITQFEAIAARQVFPGFDDPGFKVPFDLTVVAREEDVVITTTPELSAKGIGDGRVRHVFATTRPLPTYLLAFAVGPYDVVDYGRIPANPVRNRQIALRGFAAKGQGGRMKYALRNTNGLLTALEKYFGTGYPYEKLDLIAVPESFGGAMENVGAITYDEYFLLMDENSPLDQRRSYTTIHAHELAHMWFGNLVTPAWWNDIWLNESFATWMENKGAHAHWPEGEFDRQSLKGALGAMANDSLAAAREIREPVENNDEINGVFDSITYEKGGGVLSMLERFVGPERFQAGVRLHIQRHEDGTATSEDFIESIAAGSNRAEIKAAFRTFIEQPGVPLVSVKLDCKDEQNPRLDVRQARYAPLGSSIMGDSGEWQIPFCFAFDVDGKREDHCELLRNREQSLNLTARTCPTGLHPNADGAGYYRFTMDDAGWRGLVAGAAELSAAEALVFADSLDAAFRAGVLSAEFYVSGMAALANHESWDVVDAVADYLEKIAKIIDASHLAPVEQAFREIATRRYATLTGASDSGSILLRQHLQRFLAIVANDKAMRQPLAEKAAAIVGLNRDPSPSAAPAIEYETIFSVGVQDLGEPFFDLLLKQALASEDAAFRDDAIGALARVEDPVLVRKLQTAVLAGDLKGVEMIGALFRQIQRPATTELTYAWLRENDDAILGMIPETFRSNVVPQLGTAFCSLERAEEWRAFIESHAGELPGYERDLAQATESIQLCAALKQASAASLVAAFEYYESRPAANPRSGSVGR